MSWPPPYEVGSRRNRHPPRRAGERPLNLRERLRYIPRKLLLFPRDAMMKALIHLSIMFSGTLILCGCGPATGLVFDISNAAPGRDGRPVINIQPNGKQRPKGTGPSSGYFLMVRRNGVGYYTRWFDENAVMEGLQRDLDIPSIDIKPADKLSVAVENVHGQNPGDYVLMSNDLNLPLPPLVGP